jgi:cyclophilin family peptidyl-prolyl cis-trans isomerase
MLDGRKDILKAMRQSRVRVAVMAAEEYTTDVPEHSFLKPKLYWDRRARGLGATPTNPVVSCSEENLLGFPGDPYPDENIFVHEFAHAIHGTGLNQTDPTFDERLQSAYRAAIERGLWKNTYAATNHSEYWAEGVQSWFDDNAPPDALHNDVRTRARLKEYDPALAKLCQEVFGDGAWRYRRPALRDPADRRHLVGYDPEKLPRFGWRETPLGDKPRATIQTSLGDFDVELDVGAGREATSLFLKIALDGGYHSGRFHRAVRDAHEPANGFVSAKVNPRWLERSAKRLKLEGVAASTTRPEDATIALVRGGDAVGAFVIFVGSPPERFGDVVPFGRVVKGRDELGKILASPLDGETLKTPTDIRRIIRTE